MSPRPTDEERAADWERHEAASRALLQRDARRPPGELLDEAQALISAAFDLLGAASRAR